MNHVCLLLPAMLCCQTFRLAAIDLPQMCMDPSSTTLENLRQIALNAWSQKEFAKAGDCYREIVNVTRSGQTPPSELSNDLHNLGLISSELGQYANAKEYYQRELKLRGEANDLVGAGVAYSSLGAVLQIEGSFPDAETCFKKAVTVLSRYAGPNDLKTAMAFNRLGWLYTLWGRTDEANESLQKADEAAEKALPGDDPALIKFLDIHASFLSTIGRYAEAEKLWTRALQIGEKAYPNDDAKFDEVLLHLGQTYSALGDYKSAEETFRRFLYIRKPSGPDGTARAVVTAEIARVYMQQRRYKDAEQYLNRSVNMMEAARDPVPQVYSLIRSYFGDYYMARSKWLDAELQYRSALQMRQAMLGKSSPDVAATMCSLAKALQKLHRKQEAAQYLTQAAAIMESQKNPAYAGATIDVGAFGGGK